MKAHAILLSLLVAGHAIGSEEEIANWTNIEMTTAPIPKVGKVSISATTESEKLSKLEIFAFGKTHVVLNKDLEKIADFPLGSLEITHGAGYEELGGYSVHVKLRRIFYNHEKNLKDQMAIITVTQKKGLSPATIRDN